MLSIEKPVILSILSGAYTPLDLREFVQFCHDLALPLIRKKRALGKIDLSTFNLAEGDLAYDCIAEIFRRDQDGRFGEISTFFENYLPGAAERSTGELIGTLRRLVFSKVNQNLIRLYSEADPSLGKVLRNLRIALDKSPDFRREERFGDIHLVTTGADPLLSRERMPFDELEQRFYQVVLAHDPVPSMLSKLRDILVDQDCFQRAVPLMSAALLFRNTYTLGWDSDQAAAVVEESADTTTYGRMVDDICRDLRRDLHRTYVGKGKCDDALFENYIEATRTVLNATFIDAHLDGSTHFEYLKVRLPELTREEYRRDHRQVLEYMTKLGRERLRHELRNERP